MKKVTIEFLNTTVNFHRGELKAEEKHGGICAEITADADAMLQLRLPTDNQSTISAALAAVKIYLECVVGLPFGEYDVSINSKYHTVALTKENKGKFSLNTGKCKLLSTNNRLNNDIYGLDFYEIQTDFGYVRLLLCDNIDSFDINRIGAVVCLAPTVYEPPLGVCALSSAGSAVSLKYYKFGASQVPPPIYAYSAAAELLYRTRGTEHFTVTEPCAEVKYCKRGVVITGEEFVYY